MRQLNISDYKSYDDCCSLACLCPVCEFDKSEFMYINMRRKGQRSKRRTPIELDPI